MKEYIEPASSLSFPFNKDCSPYSIQLEKGKFKFEAWGASGGNDYGGHGAYATGIIKLNEPQQFFIFVGGQGEDAPHSPTNPKGGCNGGGFGGLSSDVSQYNNGAGGGGSTDIRYNLTIISAGEEDSRILVAAGGGGAGAQGLYDDHALEGGVGGAETGGIASGFSDTFEERKKVATQTEGFKKLLGQNGRDALQYYFQGSEGSGGAGGGYYGGFAVQKTGERSTAGGGGGSSYANKNLFLNYQLKSGDMQILSPQGHNEIGHFGNGFFRITPLTTFTCPQPRIISQRPVYLTFVFFVFMK